MKGFVKKCITQARELQESSKVLISLFYFEAFISNNNAWPYTLSRFMYVVTHIGPILVL